MSVSIIQYPNDLVTSRDIYDLIRRSYATRVAEGIRFVFNSYDFDSFCSRFNYSDNVVLTAIDSVDQRLVGTLSMRFTKKGKGGELFWLAVSPDSRGKGVSQQLFSAIINYARKEGLLYLQSDTATKAKSSIRAHKKAGFRITGFYSFRSTDYYSYIFTCPLSQDSKYLSPLYCQLSFIKSFLKTKLIRNVQGRDRLIFRLYRFLIQKAHSVIKNR